MFAYILVLLVIVALFVPFKPVIRAIVVIAMFVLSLTLSLTYSAILYMNINLVD